MSRTYGELRALTDEELIAEHDANSQNAGVGVSYYLEELSRRERVAQTAAIIELTREGAKQTDTVRRLTFVITVLTAVNVVAAIVTAVAAFK